MTLQKVHTDRAPAAVGPYSQAVKAGPWLFVSGQIGLNPQSGELVSGFAEQVKQALVNMREILQAAGLELTTVAAVDVFVTDMAQFGLLNQIYEEFFSGHRPARAVVEVTALPKGASVEIKCVAYGGR